MNVSNPEVDRQEKRLEVGTKANIVYVVNGKLGLEAVENKILILVDKFKSGYDCKSCDGTGVYNGCECAKAGRFGTNANGKKCTFVEACYKQIAGEKCLICNGTGTTVGIPENARALPTSGIIVSLGPDCTKRKHGQRVLFGAHTGYYIPFKGNAKIRCMREDEPLCLLYSGDNEIALGDLVQIEDTEY